jgi:hypothetical protein
MSSTGRNLLVVLLVLCIAAAVAEGVLIAKLSQENANLSAEWQDALKNGGPELSRKIAREESELQVLRVQAQELLKLRRDVRDLRSHTNEISRLEEENRQLKESQTNVPQPGQTASADLTAAADNSQPAVPRESWAFAGYSTPAAAVQSALWSLASGDIDTYLAGLTDANRTQVEAQLQPNTPEADQAIAALTRSMSGATSFQITDQTAVSDTTVAVTISIPGAQVEQERFLVTEANGEWRISGSGANQ